MKIYNNKINGFFAVIINACLLVSIFGLQVGSSAYARGSSDLPKGYFRTLPGKLNSKSALSVLHDSGEAVVFANTKLSNKGKLSKLKSFTVLHKNSDERVEYKFKSRGQKVQIKTSDNTKITLTIDPATNQFRSRVKTKNAEGKSVKADLEDTIGNYGAHWFKSIALLDDLHKKLKETAKTEGPLDPYNELGFAGSRTASVGISSEGSLNLGLSTGATIARAMWAGVKVISIATGIVAVGVALTGVVAGTTVASTVGAGILAILGIAGVASTFWDIMKYTDPDLESDTTDEAFELTGATSATYENITLIMQDGTKVLTKLSKAGVGIAEDLLASFLEKASHKVARGLVLKVFYTWPADQNDLDTATSLLGDTVGFGCGSTSTYMDWTGDDTGAGGAEIVTVRISDAASNNALPTTFAVEAFAGWYSGNTGSGPASLELFLENPDSGVRYGQPVFKTIAPGSQSGCASTPVGGADFTWDSFTSEISWDLR